MDAMRKPTATWREVNRVRVLLIIAIVAALTQVGVSMAWSGEPDDTWPFDVTELAALSADDGLFTAAGPDQPSWHTTLDQPPALSSTFAVALLAEHDRFGELAGDRLAKALQPHLDRARADGSWLDLLLGAVILDTAGQPDSDLVEEAAQHAERFLSEPITYRQVDTARTTILAMTRLGRATSDLEVEPFSVTDRERRYAAWRFLAMPSVSDVDEVVADVDLLNTKSMVVLDNADEYPTKEVLAAYHAINASNDSGSMIGDLGVWTQNLRGCLGVDTLYRNGVNSHDCSLEATLDLFHSGFIAVEPPDRS